MEPFRRAQPAPRLERILPIARDLRRYRGGGARNDVLAGLTVAALAIPSGMAYAQLAGLTPVIGLYALLLPVVGYALLGSSRQVAVGPEGTLAALVAAALVGIAAPGSGEAGQVAAALALMVGACFLIARLARLEWIAEYLSRPVLVGYLHGVAVVLIVGQLGKLLGIPLHATDPVGQLGDVLDGLGDVSGTTALVSLVALAMPIGASGSRSAVNEGMGAVSQVSGLVAAVAVAIVLVVLTGPIADLRAAGIVDRLGGARAVQPTIRAAVDGVAAPSSPPPGDPASPSHT